MTDVSAAPSRADEAARDALARARAHLLSLQEPAGFWRGLLETNASMDAEDLLLREFLGIREEQRSALSAARNWKISTLRGLSPRLAVELCSMLQ